jgi:glycine/D-amino acid oxidase-like deaminating enzyme
MPHRSYQTSQHGETTLGGVSFWLQQVGIPEPTDQLDGDAQADYCIVGGGLTGLWTAYYLSIAEPDAKIVVLEREFAGFGASGRNAGWLTAEFAGKFDTFAARGGRDSVGRLVTEMNNTVDEVIRVSEAESFNMDAHKGGILLVARNEVQKQRIQQSLEVGEQWGVGEGHTWLSESETQDRMRLNGAIGARFNPNGARIHPAKMVRGLAEVVRARGVRIHEGTAVHAIEPGKAFTERGVVHAPVILRCLEGYTASLKGLRREWLPMNSSLVVTEVLPDSMWDEIGWDGHEVMADAANALACAQRTADGRIAMGGRGMLPGYRYGSKTDLDGITTNKAVDILIDTLHDLFPQTKGVPVVHGWCGVIGVPRNWTPSMCFDPKTGLGWAGGYVGSGVGTTNLAGRTLTDLATGRDTDITHLPWVNHGVRRWEPEPVRWLGVRSMYQLFKAADKREASGLGSQSRLTKLGAFLTGR